MFKFQLLLFVFLNCAVRAKDTPFQVVFTANRQGEVEPCHCQTNQIGGISRLANYLEKTKKEFKGATFFVDSGDTFFSVPVFPDALREREHSKAKLIAKAYKVMGLDLIFFGERDFALGLASLSELLQLTGAVFPPPESSRWESVIEKGDTKLGIISISKPTSIEDSISRLKEKQVVGIVVLSQLGFLEDKKLAEKNDNILIVGARSLAGGEKPALVGKSVIVETVEGGKNIGRVVFRSPSVISAKFEFINLDKGYEKENRVTKLVKEFQNEEKNKKIKEDGKLSEKDKHNAYVANPFVCKQCHEKQFEFWKSTKHSSAYLVLYSKNQHFDPDCVSCHVLGYDESNGFKKISQPILMTEKQNAAAPFVESLMRTVFDSERKPIDSRKEPEKYKALHDKYFNALEKLHTEKKLKKVFMGVQCEHCHGNRSEHLAQGVKGTKSDVPNTCLACHRAPNALDFKASMIPLASCPK